ncbi:MAG TPA: zf-HC2 domain-containing protein, partial [Anaerolineae bacterium]
STMNDKHLSDHELDHYVEKELDDRARVQADEHLANCERCRSLLTRELFLSVALRAVPREQPPSDFAVRIGNAAQARVLQQRLQRARMPFITVATFFSLLLLLWFGFQMAIAFVDNGTFEILSLLSGQPDLFSTFFVDGLWALLEALPLGEIVLTLFALFTVIVLAEQWVETVRPPRVAQFRKQ